MRRPSLETILFWSALALLLGLYLAPLWSVRYLPSLDLPMHLSLAAAYHDVGDGATLASRVYESRGSITPYLGFYALTGALAHLMPILAALKLVIALTALGLVGATLLALSAFGRSRWLVFLSLPLLWDVNASYGYFPFRLSVALAIAGLALARRDLDGPSLRRELALGAIAVLTYLTHAHGFALLCLLWGLTVVLGAPRLRVLFRALAPLLPALLLSTSWYLSALFAAGPRGQTGTRIVMLPLIRLMELIPHRLLNSLADGRDELVALGIALAWGALIAVSPRPPLAAWAEGAGRFARARARLAGHTLELATGLMVILYFVTPNQLLTPTQQLFGMNYRFLIVICLLATMVPRVDLRGWRALGILPVLLLSAHFGLALLEEHRAFDARYRPHLDRVIAAIPRGQRVMAFNYEVSDPRFTVPVLNHFVGYYTAQRDGVSQVNHTGTSYQYMPVKLRDERALPTPPFPGPVPMAIFMPRYDYFLIQDRPGSRRAPFDLRPLRLVVEAGPWRVYGKR
jgi:hypothetical protein